MENFTKTIKVKQKEEKKTSTTTTLSCGFIQVIFTFLTLNKLMQKDALIFCKQQFYFV